MLGGDVDDGFTQSETRLVTNRLKSTNKCLTKFLALKICQTHRYLMSGSFRRSDVKELIGDFVDIYLLFPESGHDGLRVSARDSQAIFHCIVLAPIFVITQSSSYFTGNICLHLFFFHIHFIDSSFFTILDT